jgi:hypothetical protein
VDRDIFARSIPGSTTACAVEATLNLGEVGQLPILLRQSCADGHNEQYAVNVSAFEPRPAAFDSKCPTDAMFYSDAAVGSVGDEIGAWSAAVGFGGVRVSR